MKIKDEPRTTPISVFTEAALKYFKCKPEDIEIRMITENKEAFLIYKGEGYKISTREMLREDIEFQLTNKEAALQIDLGCWIQATKNTVVINRILGILVRNIENTEQAKKLLIAVGLGAYTDDADIAFWEILSRIDHDGELLGNAMVIVVQVYSGAGLINDLTDLQILHGPRVYNRITGGIFETVYVEDNQRGAFELYLYSTESYLTA
jgi:hypothetical protein